MFFGRLVVVWLLFVLLFPARLPAALRRGAVVVEISPFGAVVGDDAAPGDALPGAAPVDESSEGGTGVDITSPVRVTTTICTSSGLAPFAGMASALASSGVTDVTS